MRRISTRLAIALASTVLIIMAAYITVSDMQRRMIFRADMENDAQALGEVLQLASQELLAAGRISSLDQLLRTVRQDEEVFAALVLDPQGAVVAGSAGDLPCLQRYLHSLPAAQPVTGRAVCRTGVHWLALPLNTGGSLIVGIEQILLDRSTASALQRQILFIALLTLTITLAILVILRQTLSQPMDQVMEGVRALAASGRAPRIELGEAAGELVELAEAFNEMSAQLERKHQQLEHEAEERVSLERRLNESEKFAMLGRISGGLAHELGSPLSVIGMRSEALQLAPGLPPSAQQHARLISIEVQRMTEFVQGLLHMARKHGIVYEPVDMGDLVQSLREDMALRMEGSQVEMELVIPPEPVIVRGQATLLRHALRNLIRNAYHALQKHPAERKLRVRVLPDDHEVLVLVEDSGPGIAPEHQEHLFEPFYTTKQAGEGSGLGLPISRGIIEEHGGELMLKNRAEGGTCAVITLPRFDEFDGNGARSEHA